MPPPLSEGTWDKWRPSQLSVGIQAQNGRDEQTSVAQLCVLWGPPAFAALLYISTGKNISVLQGCSEGLWHLWSIEETTNVYNGLWCPVQVQTGLHLLLPGKQVDSLHLPPLHVLSAQGWDRHQLLWAMAVPWRLPSAAVWKLRRL